MQATGVKTVLLALTACRPQHKKRVDLMWGAALVPMNSRYNLHWVLTATKGNRSQGEDILRGHTEAHRSLFPQPRGSHLCECDMCVEVAFHPTDTCDGIPVVNVFHHTCSYCNSPTLRGFSISHPELAAGHTMVVMISASIPDMGFKHLGCHGVDRLRWYP